MKMFSRQWIHKNDHDAVMEHLADQLDDQRNVYEDRLLARETDIARAKNELNVALKLVNSLTKECQDWVNRIGALTSQVEAARTNYDLLKAAHAELQRDHGIIDEHINQYRQRERAMSSFLRSHNSRMDFASQSKSLNADSVIMDYAVHLENQLTQARKDFAEAQENAAKLAKSTPKMTTKPDATSKTK